MRVDIEKIQILRKKLRDFNQLSIYDMEFYEDGKKLEIPKEVLDEWELIGLNNADFIDTKFWKGKTVQALVEMIQKKKGD